MNGVCPKCNQSDIYTTSIDSQKILPDNLSWGKRPPVDNLVCGNCGYIEFYIAPDALDGVKKTWIRKSTKD